MGLPYPSFGDANVGGNWGPPNVAAVMNSYNDVGARGPQSMQQGEEALAKMQQRRDQTKALRGVVKSYAPAGPQGDTIKAWAETAGVGDLEGFVQGQAAQTERAKMQAQAQDLQAQADQRSRDANDSQALQQVWQSYGDTDATKIEPRDFMSKYMKAGGSPYGLAKAGQFFKDITGNSTEEENPLEFDTTSIPGNTVVKTKRGAGFQVVPSATDTSAGAQPMTSPEGTLLGYNIPTGSAKNPYKFQPLKEMTDEQKQSLILQHQKIKASLIQSLPLSAGNPDSLKAINEEIATHQGAIEQLRGKDKGKPSPPAEEATRVTVQDKSGKKFTLPQTQLDAAKAQGYTEVK